MQETIQPRIADFSELPIKQTGGGGSSRTAELGAGKRG